EDQQVEVDLVLERVQRVGLALPDKKGRIGLLPPLGVGADHEHTGRPRQLAQLEHLLFDGRQPLILVIEGHQVGAFLPAVGITNQLASPVIIPTRSRSTITPGSAGSHCTRRSARNQVSWRRAYWRTWRTVESRASASDIRPSRWATNSG